MSVSLSNIVDVDVQVSRVSTISSDFNLGLIIGSSLESETNVVKTYDYISYATEMVSDGYATSSPEYLAAVAYFSQAEKSNSLVVAQKTVNQSPATAFTAIRALNNKFYCFCFVDELNDTQITNVAPLVEASAIPTVFFYSTDDAAVVTAESSNIMKTLKEAGYTRSFGFYSSDNDICPAAVGLISAMNSMKIGSAYTAAYKTLAGVTPENITDAQLNTLTGYNGNAYITFGNSYNFTYPMISAGGYHMDDIYFIDAAKHTIQNSVVSGLVSQRKVPQTESGVTTIVNYIASACDTLAKIGFIAGGIWRGADIQDLKTGDAIQNGFYIQAGSIADQPESEISSRIAPQIYVALLSSGAIEHVIIRVIINE